jgi:hypothetical protein
MFKLLKNKVSTLVSGMTLGLVGLLYATKAGAQSIPTWDASSTETVVTASAAAFKTTFVYVLQVMAPYAIIISLIVGLVWFFVRLARSH